MVRRITTNNNKNSSTKTDVYHGDDDDIDDNDKYTKIKTSNNHLSRKVFVFIALACTIAANVFLVNSTSNTRNTRTSNSRSTSIASTVIASDLEHNAGIDELHSTSTTDNKDTSGDPTPDHMPRTNSSTPQKRISNMTLGIPHTLFFTYKYDILERGTPKRFYDNVMNTIDKYRNALSNDTIVRFLTDDDCRALIEVAEPRLVVHFNRETLGMHKGDICRIAALFEEGGYYFDVDLQVTQALQLKDDIQFATCLHPNGKEFFQAFLAATARHPILKNALDKMLAYYNGQLVLHGDYMGTSTLFNAFDATPKEHRGPVLILDELNLDDDSSRFPEIIRRKDNVEGCCCNFVVHDSTSVYFWSRIIGTHIVNNRFDFIKCQSK